jgi:hypothetical protein
MQFHTTKANITSGIIDKYKECLLYSFFWAITRRLNFRNALVSHLTPLMKMGQCSETSVHKIQTLENHPEERIEHSEIDEILKSRISNVCKQLGILQYKFGNHIKK